MMRQYHVFRRWADRAGRELAIEHLGFGSTPEIAAAIADHAVTTTGAGGKVYTAWQVAGDDGALSSGYLTRDRRLEGTRSLVHVTRFTPWASGS